MHNLSTSDNQVSPKDQSRYLSLLMQELWVALGQIRGCVTTLLQESIQPDEATSREFLNDIDENLRLMDRLLVYGKQLTTLELEGRERKRHRTRLEPLILATLNSLPPEANVEMYSVDGMPDVNVDAAHFERLFGALMNNAIQHATSEGIEVQARLEDSQVVIEIICRSPKATVDCLSDLFDPIPHYRAGDVGALESALDRYLAHALVVIAGGKVWASALPETGISLFIGLPPSEASSATANPAAIVIRKPTGRSKAKVRAAARHKHDAFTILVADDEQAILDILRHYLESAGYKVLVASDGRQTVELVATQRPDLVLLDMNMPDITGLEVTAEVREFSTVPIIMVTGDPKNDVATSLNAGIDDYLSKPVKRLELLARVNACIRRETIYKQPEAQETFITGDLTVDFAQRLVTMRGRTIKLGRQEYKLLAYLAINAGHTLSRDQILENIWGAHSRGQYDYVWIYIKRLREKLGDDGKNPKYIVNNPGLGYYIALNVDPSP